MFTDLKKTEASMWKRNIDQMPTTYARLGIKHAIFLVYKTMLQPTELPSQGKTKSW